MKGKYFSTRLEKAEWLRANPGVAALPDTQVVKALKKAGLVSETTLTIDVRVNDLLKMAKLTRLSLYDAAARTVAAYRSDNGSHTGLFEALHELGKALDAERGVRGVGNDGH